MIWVVGVLVVVLLCFVTALGILWSRTGARADRLSPAHEPDRLVWRRDGPDGPPGGGRAAPRRADGPGRGEQRPSPEQHGSGTSDGSARHRPVPAGRRLDTDVARLGRKARRALNSVPGKMPMVRRRPREEDESYERPERAVPSGGAVPERETGDARGNRPVPGVHQPLPEAHQPLSDDQRQLPGHPAAPVSGNAPGRAPAQPQRAQHQPEHHQPVQHRSAPRPARPHESQPQPYSAAAAPSGATGRVPTATPHPADEDVPTRHLRADTASYDGPHAGTAPGTPDDRPDTPGPDDRITTAVTWLRPQGYVEWEGAMHRAHWHGSASAFPRPGSRVRVAPSPDPLVLEARPLD
ncbi:hypothetical protein [Streptomyces sp. JHA26]|uniref:hypothetical protein n=1 Tax=Streptomyces sp. JHA26 TaxID=1917143 RepID=UPI00098BBF87|nr:hypothetical protein [Streptomyces sp. JHA26]